MNQRATSPSIMSFPVNRVPDILKRMDLNSSQAEAMKTCFGILAIMSREDANKLLIAKDGMEIILNAMTVHVDRTDVQESGCDLLWSLAFNSASTKDIIAKHGGATVLVRALKRHSRFADFLKSACGALSNMCQSKVNQSAVASQGGLQPLVGSIHVHQTNAKLLPFVFDAIASIIVNNEENALTVSALGIIPVVVASLSRHKGSTEVVKSGCHTLAILSDVKGQASKIAFAGGVPIILSLLDVHPLYSDLHRVAAVVLLRMLQESAHVGREITCNDGVRILLYSLEKGGAQQDTVAAVTHILYTVTNPSSPASSAIEPQLWLHSKAGQSPGVVSGTAASAEAGSDSALTVGSSNAPNQTSALGGIVIILGQYSHRRDVVRAACRLITNLCVFPNVINALDKLHVLDKMLECVSVHRETRDVVDSTTSLIKTIQRRSAPHIICNTSGSMNGLLHLYKIKFVDEDAIAALAEVCSRLLEASHSSTAAAGKTGGGAASDSTGNKRKEKNLDDIRSIDGKIWEFHVVSTSLNHLGGILELERAAELGESAAHPTIPPPTNSKINTQPLNKNSIRAIASIATLLEGVCLTNKLCNDPIIYRDSVDTLNDILKILPSSKNTELVRRIERLLPLLEQAPKKADEKVKSSKRKGGNLVEDISTTSAKIDRGVLPLIDSATSNGNSNGGGSDTVTGRSSLASSLNAVGNGKSDTTSKTDIGGESGPRSSTNSGSKSINKVAGSSSGYALPRSTPTVQPSSDQMCYFMSSKGDGKKLLPQHPTKAPNAGDKLLLDSWPNYLERLLMPANPALNRVFVSQADVAIPTRMQLVYESGSAAGKNLASRSPTPCPYSVPPGGVGDPFDHSLTFDSEFESGNLYRVIQKGDAQYDMCLRSDLHTPGHTQWFYFAVSNTHPSDLVRLSEQGVQVPPVRVKFNIINFTKPDSLFNLGMRPVVYSSLDAATKGTGWIRSGSDISYYSNSFLRGNSAGEGANCYYTLTFTVEFHNPKDTVLIAYCYPYTLADCNNHINKILSRPGANDFVRQTKLCSTLNGDECPLLVVTNFRDREKEKIGPVTVAGLSGDGDGSFDLQPMGSKMGASGKMRGTGTTKNALKPALFLSARVHPGETPASWMMKGILDFLTSDCSQAKLLRQVFVIFIVPMLNPDGVTFGNNRCSLAGVDLNRQWKLPVKALHPTIYYFKAFMAAQRRIREISMYIDLHGHSRKYNVFMYGCDDKKKPKPQVRAFPKFFSMHGVGKKYVCFADCSFHVRKGRESTARVVVAKELNIPCSFTLEATFCGSNYGPLKHCHMNIGHLQEVGAALSDAFLNFSIAEGYVKDTLQVPGNLKAVQLVEKALAAELNDGVDFGGFGGDHDDTGHEYMHSMLAPGGGSSSSLLGSKSDKVKSSAKLSPATALASDDSNQMFTKQHGLSRQSSTSGSTNSGTMFPPVVNNNNSGNCPQGGGSSATTNTVNNSTNKSGGLRQRVGSNSTLNSLGMGSAAETDTEQQAAAVDDDTNNNEGALSATPTGDDATGEDVDSGSEAGMGGDSEAEISESESLPASRKGSHNTAASSSIESHLLGIAAAGDSESSAQASTSDGPNCNGAGAGAGIAANASSSVVTLPTPPSGSPLSPQPHKSGSGGGVGSSGFRVLTRHSSGTVGTTSAPSSAASSSERGASSSGIAVEDVAEISGGAGGVTSTGAPRRTSTSSISESFGGGGGSFSYDAATTGGRTSSGSRDSTLGG